MPATTREARIIDVARSDGRRIRARRRAGSGTTVVFLHGLLDSSEGWDEIAAATPRPSVAFDLPGFGASDLPTRPRVSAYAEDITAAIRELDLTEVTLVGHSFGGAVATAVAERVPERIDSLVLLAPAGFGRIALAEAVSIPGVRAVAATLMPLWLNVPLALGTSYRLFVTAGHSPATEVIARVRRDAASLVPAAVCATQAVVAAGQSRHGFHRRRVGYRGPVAALWGEADHVVPPKHADGVMHAFPQARLTSWSGMGHHPQRERAAELVSFVESAGACASAVDRTLAATRKTRRAVLEPRPAAALAAA